MISTHVILHFSHFQSSPGTTRWQEDNFEAGLFMEGKAWLHSCCTALHRCAADGPWSPPKRSNICRDSLEHVGHTRRARPSSSCLPWSCRKSTTVWVGGIRVGVRWARTEDAALLQGVKPTGSVGGDALVAEQVTGAARWSRQRWNDDGISMRKHIDYRQQHIINPMWDDKPATESNGRGWPGNQLQAIACLRLSGHNIYLLKLRQVFLDALAAVCCI